MPSMSVNDFLVMISDIDTYGHAELVQNKIKLMDELLDKLQSHEFGDASMTQVPSDQIKNYCTAINEVLQKPEYQKIFAKNNDDFSFKYTELTVGNLLAFEAAVAKKRANLLLASAPKFLDKENIDTVKSNLDAAIEKAKSEEKVLASTVKDSDEMKAAVNVFSSATTSVAKFQNAIDEADKKITEENRSKMNYEDTPPVKELNKNLAKLTELKNNQESLNSQYTQASIDAAALHPAGVRRYESHDLARDEEKMVLVLDEKIKELNSGLTDRDTAILNLKKTLVTKTEEMKCKKKEENSAKNIVDGILLILQEGNLLSRENQLVAQTHAANAAVLQTEIDGFSAKITTAEAANNADRISIDQLNSEIKLKREKAEQIRLDAEEQHKTAESNAANADKFILGFSNLDSINKLEIENLNRLLATTQPAVQEELSKHQSIIDKVELERKVLTEQLKVAQDKVNPALQMIEKAKGKLPELIAKHKALDDSLKKVNEIEQAKIDFQTNKEALDKLTNNAKATSSELKIAMAAYETSLKDLNTKMFT